MGFPGGASVKDPQGWYRASPRQSGRLGEEEAAGDRAPPPL